MRNFYYKQIKRIVPKKNHQIIKTVEVSRIFFFFNWICIWSDQLLIKWPEIIKWSIRYRPHGYYFTQEALINALVVSQLSWIIQGLTSVENCLKNYFFQLYKQYNLHSYISLHSSSRMLDSVCKFEKLRILSDLFNDNLLLSINVTCNFLTTIRFYFDL